MPVVDMHDRRNFRQYVFATPDSNYAWVIYGALQVMNSGQYKLCISSDDGSRLYLGTNSSTLQLSVDDDGLHGMLERCSTTSLTAGNYLLYIEGFQQGTLLFSSFLNNRNRFAPTDVFHAGGGVGMEAWYSGPDTGGDKVLIRSGHAFGSASALSKVPYQLLADSQKYFPPCDPTAASDSTSWAICVFRSEVGLSRIPALESADTGIGRIYFVGKGSMPVIDITTQDQFSAAVPFTPDANYAWAMFGKLLVGAAGSYQLCIASDDG